MGLDKALCIRQYRNRHKKTVRPAAVIRITACHIRESGIKDFEAKAVGIPGNFYGKTPGSTSARIQIHRNAFHQHRNGIFIIFRFIDKQLQSSCHVFIRTVGDGCIQDIDVPFPEEVR